MRDREIIENRENRGRHRHSGVVSRAEREVGEVATQVAAAATAFEGRWTQLALRRQSPDLADRLNEQIKLWHDEVAGGDEEEILAVGRALIRGYRLTYRIMEGDGVPDDAYQFGQARDGTIVSFGPVAAAGRVAERYPDKRIAHFTFDEAAELLANGTVAAVKAQFPGAEIKEVRNG
jgi:hypothetical protein